MVGPLFAMKYPTEIDLDLMFGSKRERDGQLHARIQCLDLVKLRVAELPVLDDTLSESSANSFQSGHPASFDAPAPTNGISFVSCAASRSAGGTSGIGGIASVMNVVALASTCRCLPQYRALS